MNRVTETLLQDYYAAFNRQDMDAFLALLADDVVHDINQGGREIGKSKFAQFMERMNSHYREQIVDISIMTNEQGDRGAAEFTVLGTYLKTDSDLPEATSQQYSLPAGAFFEIRDGKITRVTNYYNLTDWIQQVTA
jgi:steroid delta-isomerase-like uncharacterized protein